VNQTTDSLVVECLPGFDGGLEQRFHMEVTDLQTGHLITNTTGELLPEFEVSGLNSGRGMKITIFAVNTDGRSDSAILEGFTLKVAELQVGKFEIRLLAVYFRWLKMRFQFPQSYFDIKNLQTNSLAKTTK
jgi:hypothetical protein